MLYSLQVLETITIDVKARDFYSHFSFDVKQGHVYEFNHDSHTQWCDWYKWCGADGYDFPLASWIGMRVKNAKCFSLCGSYNQERDKTFLIGSSNKILIDQNAHLYLFANDVKGFYWNNFGYIRVHVTRVH